MRRRLRVYAYMIDDCESIILLRQRVQGEKLIRSGWGLPKENLSRNGENSSLFAQNRLLCHWCTSKLCPCAFYSNDRFDRKKRKKKKKKYLGHFDYSTPFLGSVESVLNVLNGGEIIFFARKKKNTCNFNYYLVNFILITHQFVDKSVRKRERVWKRARMYECFNVGHCYKLT